MQNPRLCVSGCVVMIAVGSGSFSLAMFQPEEAAEPRDRSVLDKEKEQFWLARRGPRENPAREQWTIPTAAAAITRVQDVLELPMVANAKAQGKAEAPQGIAELVMYGDDGPAYVPTSWRRYKWGQGTNPTPEQLYYWSDTHVWRVVFKKVELALPSSNVGGRASPEDQTKLVRRVVAFLDPYWGSLCRIEIHNDASPQEAPREPSPAQYARQIRDAGVEEISRVVETGALRLPSALAVVQREMGGVLEAKMVVVVPIQWSKRLPEGAPPPSPDSVTFGSPRDCWAIDLRGIPPMPASSPDVPVEAKNHLRHIVDARTGRWLCASTVPQPEPPDPNEPLYPPRPADKPLVVEGPQ